MLPGDFRKKKLFLNHGNFLAKSKLLVAPCWGVISKGLSLHTVLRLTVVFSDIGPSICCIGTVHILLSFEENIRQLISSLHNENKFGNKTNNKI